MKTSIKYRSLISDLHRVVIKIGSRVLVQKSGRPDVRRMKMLVKNIASLVRQGYEPIIITSGAIGAGVEALGMKKRPTLLPDLQMAAAVGQSRLMAKYDKLFSAEHCKIGQVLLTHNDFNHEGRLINVRRTMENLIRHKVIPIVNENDVVADEEIRADNRLGDNDRLAALVSKQVRADLLIILTTSDGVRKPAGNGKTKRVRCIESITKNILSLANGKKSELSVGGMATKLKAAQSATNAGCYVVIADGRKNNTILNVMSGDDVGTMILASL